ncbi:MAG: 50S ribosomal protein L11 [Candidatus Woesearchaeota archaeon]|nr:MAG: 50S ribosomal protein L11 [Candidatus Woesearchaeota archaeon]
MSKETIELMVEGGKAVAGAQMGQSLGPLKINISEVIQKINTKTAAFKGMKVPVKVIVETETKNIDLEVGTPPTSELIKKELALEKGSGTPNIDLKGNLAIEEVIKIALMKKDSMLVNSLKAAVKNVTGSCNSLGVLIEGKNSKDINKDIDAGLYDKEIKAQKTEVSGEKKTKLKEQLDVKLAEIKAAIEKAKAEAEKVAAESGKPAEEAKEEAATTEEGAAEGVTKSAKPEEVKKGKPEETKKAPAKAEEVKKK